MVNVPILYRSSRPEVFCKKGVIRNSTIFTGKHLCQISFFNKVAGLTPKACNFIKKDTLAQVYSCEFFKFSKNTFPYRTAPVATSVYSHYFHGYKMGTLTRSELNHLMAMFPFMSMLPVIFSKRCRIGKHSEAATGGVL